MFIINDSSVHVIIKNRPTFFLFEEPFHSISRYDDHNCHFMPIIVKKHEKRIQYIYIHNTSRNLFSMPDINMQKQRSPKTLSVEQFIEVLQLK